MPKQALPFRPFAHFIAIIAKTASKVYRDRQRPEPQARTAPQARPQQTLNG
ncbi:MAG: hypothetical protein J6K83_05590 [Bacteroidaceae bacterium]|nr:hypothetical protein [Bacteroidaceae bacterium]